MSGGTLAPTLIKTEESTAGKNGTTTSETTKGQSPILIVCSVIVALGLTGVGVWYYKKSKNQI